MLWWMYLKGEVIMDRISYECARELNDVLAWYILYACKDVKVYRYPVTGSGGHASGPFIDDMYYDDYPDDEDDDTIVAPDWNDLRKCLYSLNPSDFIASEFEAIENIDEFAHKLADYIKMKKDEIKNDYRI